MEEKLIETLKEVSAFCRERERCANCPIFEICMTFFGDLEPSDWNLTNS